MEKIKQIILPLLLLASLVLNLVQAVQIGKLSRANIPSVTGTYVDSVGPNVRFHYVLEPDGVCAVYEQFGDVERGTWRLDDAEAAESPLTMNFPSQTLCLLRTSERLYLYDPEGFVVPLQKISDAPTYVNVDR